VSTEDRFWCKVDRRSDEECWVWTAATAGKGYGKFWVAGRLLHAHRFSYELLRAPIPEGLTIDHLCRNKLCVNPAHMEVVTRGENSRRGGGGAASGRHKRSLRECSNGHEYTLDNVYLNRRGHRECRTCRRAAGIRYLTKKAAA